ncbi:MAG: hypothetical protein LUE10_02565 [Alistipes sp.]|nr:hypothetical protein [Alistipes sp.]
MMKSYIRLIFTVFVILSLLSSYGCSRRHTGASREYYSGIFRLDEDGEPFFTDCTTRIRMTLCEEGGYEALRREYGLEEATGQEPVVLTFYGRLTKHQPLVPTETPYSDSALYPLTDIEVRIDSLLSFTKAPDCVSDYIVPGFYRKIHHGQTEILRLRPDYTFSIENLSDTGYAPLSRGRWYRTSEMTIELMLEPEGRIIPFQIVPAQEAITATGPGKAAVYKKEWL